MEPHRATLGSLKQKIQVAQDGLRVSPGETVLSPKVWGAALIQWHSRGCFSGKGHNSCSDCSPGWQWRRPHKGLSHGALRGVEGSCSFHTLPGLGVRGENGRGLGLEAEGPWTLQALPSLPLPACSQVLALPSFPPPPSPLPPQPEASLSWAGGGLTRASGLGRPVRELLRAQAAGTHTPVRTATRRSTDRGTQDYVGSGTYLWGARGR